MWVKCKELLVNKLNKKEIWLQSLTAPNKHTLLVDKGPASILLYCKF